MGAAVSIRTTYRFAKRRRNILRSPGTDTTNGGLVQALPACPKSNPSQQIHGARGTSPSSVHVCRRACEATWYGQQNIQPCLRIDVVLSARESLGPCIAAAASHVESKASILLCCFSTDFKTTFVLSIFLSSKPWQSVRQVLKKLYHNQGPKLDRGRPWLRATLRFSLISGTPEISASLRRRNRRQPRGDRLRRWAAAASGDVPG